MKLSHKSLQKLPQVNIFINSVILLSKRVFKIELDERYLKTLIDESNCNWPMKPKKLKLTNLTEQNFTTSDMKSAYNQLPHRQTITPFNTICNWKTTKRIQQIV